MRHCATIIAVVCGIMIIATQVIHTTVMHAAVLAFAGVLTSVHITARSLQRLQRLRCKQYKNGQKNVFHCYNIHFHGVWWYGQRNRRKFPGSW